MSTDTPNVPQSKSKAQPTDPESCGCRGSAATFADTGGDTGREDVLVDGEDKNRWENRHAR